MSESAVLQPKELFNLINVENKEEAERVLAVAYSFLLYLKVGEKLVTSTATFNKIGHDLIQIDSKVSPELITSELVGKKIIKLPL